MMMLLPVDDLPGSPVVDWVVRCEHCGHAMQAHYAVNLTDGVAVGRYWLICPTAVFRAPGYRADGTQGPS
jgi:hypothetical protein